MKNSVFLKALRVTGSLFGFLSLIFVAFRLSDYTTQVNFANFGVNIWIGLIIFSLVYCFANVFLVIAWVNLIFFLRDSINLGKALRIYGRSQIARYIPGNIFHMAGRQALGMAHGLSGWVLAKSAAWEIGLIVIAALPFSVLVLPFYLVEFSVWASFVLYMGLFAGLVLFLRRWSVSLSNAFVFQGLFLIISGSVFCGILFLIAPKAIAFSWLPALCGAYIVAWLAGLVTPGVPAGIGIREFVLLFLLGDLIAESALLVAIIVGRSVTLLGDLFFFVIFAVDDITIKQANRQ